MRYLSTRGGQETGLVDAVMRGLAADGGLFVPDELPRFDPAAVRGESLAEISAEVLAPFFAGLRPRARARRHLPRCVRFPAAAEAAARRRRRALRARAVPRPDRRFQGRRRALSRRAHGARAAPLRRFAPADDPRRDLGRHRRRRRRGVSRRRGIRVGVLFPKGQVSPRQQHQLTCWGDNIRAFEVDGAVRRLPGARQSRVHGSGSAAAPPADRCEQHQHRPPAAAGRVSRRRELVALAAPRHGGGLDRPERQSRQRHGLRLGARDGLAGARARARREREPHDSRLSRDGAVAAAAERRYARLGDGRRQPEQHGAAAAISCPTSPSCVRASRRIPSTTRASARRSPRTMLGTARSGARIRRRPFGSTITCRRRARQGRPWIVSATAHPAKFESIVEPVIGRAVPVPPALAELAAAADGEHAAAAATRGVCG